MKVPADMLDDTDLGNGWRVVGRPSPPEDSTGGNFSVGYLVEHEEGERGFLKAMDYVSRLQGDGDMARQLEAMTTAFNYERDVLEKCAGISRVVTAIEEGEYRVPDHPVGRVQYLIFERADGDVRKYLDASAQFDLAWALRSLHHVAAGLFQMHQVDVVHQDLKPSNVLTFYDGAESKLADLGRASRRGYTGPVDGKVIAGDPQYAPPETLYRSVPTDWELRRIGCDAYHLGSLTVFMFAQGAVTPLVIRTMDPAFHPRVWQGGEYADVIPHWRDAFDRVLTDVHASMSNPYGDEIIKAVRELCEPDPTLRGHPRHRVGRGPLALERYVSLFDLLASKAEYSLQRDL